MKNRKNKRKKDNNKNKNIKKFKVDNFKFKSKFKNFDLSKIYNNLVKMISNISNVNYLDFYVIKHIIYNRFKFINYQSFETSHIIKKYSKILSIVQTSIIRIEIIIIIMKS